MTNQPYAMYWKIFIQSRRNGSCFLTTI